MVGVIELNWIIPILKQLKLKSVNVDVNDGYLHLTHFPTS